MSFIIETRETATFAMELLRKYQIQSHSDKMDNKHAHLGCILLLRNRVSKSSYCVLAIALSPINRPPSYLPRTVDSSLSNLVASIPLL
jgi:hypothetical protein